MPEASPRRGRRFVAPFDWEWCERSGRLTARGASSTGVCRKGRGGTMSESTSESAASVGRIADVHLEGDIDLANNSAIGDEICATLNKSDDAIVVDMSAVS